MGAGDFKCVQVVSNGFQVVTSTCKLVQVGAIGCKWLQAVSNGFR
jgi:hypothetical protein